MNLNLTRIIEFYIGDLLCFFFGIFKNKHKIPKQQKSILIIRDWSLGESLLALPVIKKIKSKFPKSKISVLVSPNSKLIFKNQIFIDEIIDFNSYNLFKLLFRRFDIGMDMMPYFRHSTLINYWTSRYTIGFDTFHQRSKLYDYKIKFDDKIHMTNMFDKFYIWDTRYKSKELVPLYSQPIKNKKLARSINSKSQKICIHLSTATTAPWRAWKFENFEQLIKTLLETYPKLTIFLSGSANEKEINKKMMRKVKNQRLINTQGKINLFELAWLMKRINLFISSDTGPMHISASMKCKTIGLFGPNTPARFGPYPLRKNIPIYMPPKGYKPTINVHKGEFGNNKETDVINIITLELVMKHVNKILK